jgi:hypothetical protein
MEPNVILPLASSLLSFVFALFLLDQWMERRRPHQLIWTLGMLFYGVAAGTEFVGGAFGWSELLYRAWYLTGAVWVAGWLGLGTMYLLARTRFGYAAAAAVLLAGVFTFLTWRRYDYADSGVAPYLYILVAVAAAIAIAVEVERGRGRWADVAGALVILGTLASIPMIVLAALPAPGYALDPATGIPSGELFPGYVRLLTPFFNITGGFALVLGALYSAAVALRSREMTSRVPATILLAIGGFIPSLTGGLARFGMTDASSIGELLGVLFLFAGFLVSIDVFREIRIPFTRIVLRTRRGPAS